MKKTVLTMGVAAFALALAGCGETDDRAEDDAADAAEATTADSGDAPAAEAETASADGDTAPAADGDAGGKGNGDAAGSETADAGAPPAPAAPAAPAANTGRAAPSAASAINFGDDSSEWANDGECDDPRFVGSAMAEVLLAEDTAKDATDCRAAFEQGLIGLRG